MQKDEFRIQFLNALEIAATNASNKIGKSVPHNFIIELHAPGSSPELTNVEIAENKLFLGENLSYKIIDIAVKGISRNLTKVFVRVSGHSPVGYDRTWDPTAQGPFKQIISDNIIECENNC